MLGWKLLVKTIKLQTLDFRLQVSPHLGGKQTVGDKLTEAGFHIIKNLNRKEGNGVSQDRLHYQLMDLIRKTEENDFHDCGVQSGYKVQELKFTGEVERQNSTSNDQQALSRIRNVDFYLGTMLKMLISDRQIKTDNLANQGDLNIPKDCSRSLTCYQQ